MNDKNIKQLVEHELEWEPSVDAADIGVAVDEGIVTLTGHVPSYSQKVGAERAVRRVKSVRGFVDKIEVRLFGIAESDEDIAKRAANLLDWDVTIPDGAVKVAVANGRITLTGEVPWQYQRLAAERNLRGLRGVMNLSNLITVKPQVQAADVKRRIEEALDRQADIEAGKIRVTVEGDKVRLDGKVHAWFERGIIENAAWSAPGVRHVDDHVTIGG